MPDGPERTALQTALQSGDAATVRSIIERHQDTHHDPERPPAMLWFNARGERRLASWRGEQSRAKRGKSQRV